MYIKRGEIYYADLSPVVGSEQGGMRPVLIVQNDVGNKHSPTVIAAAITSQKEKSKLPTHIALNAQSCGLAKIRLYFWNRYERWIKAAKRTNGRTGQRLYAKVDNALSVSFGLTSTL